LLGIQYFLESNIVEEFGKDNELGTQIVQVSSDGDHSVSPLGFDLLSNYKLVVLSLSCFPTCLVFWVVP